MLKLSTIVLIVLTFQISGVFAQSSEEGNCNSIKYEDHNFLPPTRLAVKKISGEVIFYSKKNNKQISLEGICLALFDDKTNKLVKTVLSDGKGKFNFKRIKKGKYRLVAKETRGDINLLCVANISLEVDDKSEKNNQLLVHMRIPDIDACSYGELVEKAP